jgi:hypothetical protein
VYVDGSTSITVGGVPASGIVFAGITSGTTICTAVDLTAQLIWFRMGAAGNWNNNAAYNPATGIGGVSIPNLGGANAAFPVASFGGADVLTGNFGDSMFVGAVPSDFTAGFPAITANVSGVQDMAFVGGPAMVLGAGAAVQLPAMVDVSGNGNSYPLYSHMRVPGGTTYTFDSGQVIVVPATTDSVFAVPTAARYVTATAASTAQMGQMQ